MEQYLTKLGIEAYKLFASLPELAQVATAIGAGGAILAGVFGLILYEQGETAVRDKGFPPGV